VIDEAVKSRPRNRAAQREATRGAILEAAYECIAEEGYANLTTRRVAERAGIAQSTLMHYFPTRDAFLTETVTHIAQRLVEDAVAEIDFAALQSPEHREAVIDQAWREFTSPAALAAAQIWNAAWAEPELAVTVRRLEERLGTIIATTAATLFPGQKDDPRFPAMIDATVAMIRGLLMAIPIAGREAVEARWQAIKPLLLESASALLD
jgi:AcrR family transcriptional regulator